VRIITGRFKGRRLRPVDDPSVRSTGDRVKESLFNILAADVADTEVLDLFCGAGTLGLEALSRGAAHATFVDSARRSINRTRDNIAVVGVEKETTIIQGDAMTSINGLADRGRRFSLVFADPPYEKGWSRRLPAALAESGILAESAIVVLEHHRKEPPEAVPAGFSLWTERRFGDTMLTIWRWTTAKSGGDAVSTPEPNEGDRT